MKPDEEIEKDLENVLFGEFKADHKIEEEFILDEDAAIQELDSDSMFVIDKTGDSSIRYESEPSKSDTNTTTVEKKQKCVWEDEDDETINVNLRKETRLKKLKTDPKKNFVDGKEIQKRLAQQYERLVSRPAWADRKEDETESHELNDLLRTSTSLLVKRDSKKALQKGLLQIQRLNDANEAEKSECVVKSVKFHKNSNLMLTAGFDKKLRLFDIKGQHFNEEEPENSKIQTVFFKDLAISQAEFTSDGQSILLSGKRRYFYSYDLGSQTVEKMPYIQGRKETSLETFCLSLDNKYIAFIGLAGTILILSQKSKQLIGTVKCNAIIKSISFSKDSKYLLCFGFDGIIYIWDIRTYSCIKKIVDEGTVKGTSLCCTNNYLVTGNDSGIVNLYNYNSVLSDDSPKPMKSFGNLTTYIDGVQIHPSEEIVASFSRTKKNAVRLAHLPSMTTFTNFPLPYTSVGHIQSMDFNSSGSLLALGNDKGNVLLYRLAHYTER